MKPSLVIAEAGVNHNGDINLGYKLIDAAKSAGADVVKFQTFSSKELATSSAKKSDYQKRNTPIEESQLEMLRRLELKPEEYKLLADYCNKVEIEFLSSAFDSSSIKILKQLDLKRIKIPSGEITNLPYIRQLCSFRKPIILSTGMSNLYDIELAINAIEGQGLKRNMLTVLHCSTQYPTEAKDVNLNAMLTIKNSFKVKVGYSDHTKGINIALAARSIGAEIIEKHITLDKNLPGPDHHASINPNEFRKLVQGIREIELSLGDGIKKPNPSEIENIIPSRKSLVAKRSIKKGQLLDHSDICAKRPGDGISPMKIDTIIGMVANKDYQKDEQIDLHL